ncbi:FUSC family protein [Streptomyces sp. LaPpAH-108]|uniref:FUSC family protein n=1 Tax=Streptomyces sp. LaPpAH-108 TaxID=1155714 RepID=UPI0003AB3272|nr:FUSC family protein [Streptomyces sp. LaPpAH-108]
MAAQVLSDIASAVRRGRPVTSVADRSVLALSEAEAARPDVRPLRGLVAALTEAERLADMGSGAAGQHVASVVPYAEPGFLVRGLRRLRAEFTWDSPVLQHALRLAVAATAAEAVGHATGDWGGLGERGHAFWLFLTAAVVLFPTFEHTFSRGISRSVGAVAGGLLGLALTLLPDDRALHYAVLAVLLLLYLAFRSTGQPLMILWITAWVSYLGAGGTSAWTRTADTVVGSAIAMAVCVLWPIWHTKRLPGLLVDRTPSPPTRSPWTGWATRPASHGASSTRPPRTPRPSRSTTSPGGAAPSCGRCPARSTRSPGAPPC